MENTKRPYHDINKWDVDRNPTKGEKLFLIVVVILVCGVLRVCINATPEKSQRLIRPEVKAEIHRRLDARGLSRATTVEITESGYRAEFEGKWIKL